MIIHVVRHGETNDNIAGRYSGNRDVELNETGINQAFELSAKLTEHKYDYVISSPLLRAAKTAEIICSHRNIDIIKMPQFRERELGVYESLTKEEIQQKYPAMWARNATRSIDDADAPDGGETFRLFNERVIGGIEEMKNKYSGKLILVVCHAGTAIVINRYFKKLSFQDMFTFRINNCEYVEYTV